MYVCLFVIINTITYRFGKYFAISTRLYISTKNKDEVRLETMIFGIDKYDHVSKCLPQLVKTSYHY